MQTPNDSSRTRTISQFRTRVLRLLTARYSIFLATGWLFLWGIAVMIARAADFLSWNSLFFGALGLIFVVPTAYYFARKRVPDEKRLGAALDGTNSAGGILMASLETDATAWLEKVPSLKVPEIKWKNDRTLLVSAGAILFVIVAFLLPNETITANQGKAFNIEDPVRRLSQHLDTLEEEKILTLEEIEKFRSSLETIKANAEGDGPDKTWDALDGLDDQIAQKANQAAEEAMKNAETLSKAEALAREAAEQISEQLDKDVAKEMMQGLGDKLSEMLADNPDLADQIANDPKLSEKVKDMLKNGDMNEMTPEQLKELAEAMKNCQNNCDRLVECLSDENMIDPDMIQALKEMSESIGKEELDRMLAELNEGCEGEACGECEGCKEGKQCQNQTKGPWRRDPAHDPSEYYADRDTDEDGAQFKSEKLPSPTPEAIKNMQKIGASIGAPEVKKGAGAGTQGGAISDTSGGTGSAHSQTILPQHRGPVGRYYDK